MQNTKIVQDDNYGFDLYDYASTIQHVPLKDIDDSIYADGKEFVYDSLNLHSSEIQCLINDLLEAGIYKLANDLVKIHSQSCKNIDLVGTNLATSPASANPSEQAAKLELARFAIDEINRPGHQNSRQGKENG